MAAAARRQPGSAWSICPSFAKVTIPDASAALADFGPVEDSPAPLEGTFTSTPSGSAEARVTLVPDGGEQQSSVDCVLIDDGSFSLPTDIAAQLSGALSPTVDSVERGANRVVVSGNAVLLLRSRAGDGS